ncbi:hypothetical protein GCM10010226_91700 [Streptomyces phaeofaciens]|uniref:Uncharacterized protein n=1 Tax=Streptomyces phaeofaciens TaxID=68254 RepID=A0A918HRF4_9ACTN|nr:hypothetical protein GCM10010226_91700 [Streptomyces phaeofaciens]
MKKAQVTDLGLLLAGDGTAAEPARKAVAEFAASVACGGRPTGLSRVGGRRGSALSFEFTDRRGQCEAQGEGGRESASTCQNDISGATT